MARASRPCLAVASHCGGFALMNEKTNRAILEFQADRGIKIDGNVDPTTRSHLTSVTAAPPRWAHAGWSSRTCRTARHRLMPAFSPDPTESYKMVRGGG